MSHELDTLKQVHVLILRQEHHIEVALIVLMRIQEPPMVIMTPMLYMTMGVVQVHLVVEDYLGGNCTKKTMDGGTVLITLRRRRCGMEPPTTGIHCDKFQVYPRRVSGIH
jgi:hypothetical protein